MAPDISVVIPTRGRAAILRMCLERLARQTLAPGRFEVLVMVDGPDAETERVAREAATRTPADMRCEVLAKGGPAVTRNRSIDSARADLIHFINDDSLLGPESLEIHLAYHARRPGQAVRGNTAFDRAAGYSPFMAWLAVYWSNSYLIRDPGDIGYEHFHTMDISIHRRWFENDRFSCGFPDAAFEDTELGYRLCQKGLNLAWAPEARCLHHHFYTPADFYARARVNGASAVILAAKHPALHHRVIGHFLAESQARRRLRLGRLRLMNRANEPAYWETKHHLVYAAAALQALRRRR